MAFFLFWITNLVSHHAFTILVSLHVWFQMTPNIHQILRFQMLHWHFRHFIPYFQHNSAHRQTLFIKNRNINKEICKSEIKLKSYLKEGREWEEAETLRKVWRPKAPLVVLILLNGESIFPMRLTELWRTWCCFIVDGRWNLRACWYTALSSPSLSP